MSSHMMLGMGRSYCRLQMMAAPCILAAVTFGILNWFSPELSRSMVDAVDDLLESVGSTEVSRGRQLQEQPAAMCRGTPAGLPVYGVQYVPHLVGEPYPSPDARPQDYYGSAYRMLHQRDLPLIRHGLGASALSLRPWPVEKRSKAELQDFLAEMGRNGVCKVVPSFHMAKYYADMLKEDKSQPNTDSSSALSKDFVRFGGSVSPEAVAGIDVSGWSIDMSLDLEYLLPLITTTCDEEPKDESYTRFKLLVEALHKWVHLSSAAGSSAPALKDVPLLVPLDLSQMPFSLPMALEKLQIFLRCMTTKWFNIFDSNSTANRTRWLLSFALPWNENPQAGIQTFFTNVLEKILDRDHGLPEEQRVVVMLGTQALRPDPANVMALVSDMGLPGQSATFNYTWEMQQQEPIRDRLQRQRYEAEVPEEDWDANLVVQDVNGNNVSAQFATLNEAQFPLRVSVLTKAPPQQRQILQDALAAYHQLRDANGRLDGFLLDEWMDDWDRGARGPFFLAKDSIYKMKDKCEDGGRFSHDADRCARKIGNKWVHPEFFGQARTASRALQHCAGPRFWEGHAIFAGNNTTAADELTVWDGPLHCSFLLPSFTLVYCALALLAVVSILQGCVIGVGRLCRDRTHDLENPKPQSKAQPKDQAAEPGERYAGYITVEPTEERLRGSHIIELCSTQMRSHSECGWWLDLHLRTQMTILEKQICAEVSARQALRERARLRSGMGEEEEEAEAAQEAFMENRSPSLRGSASSLAVGVAEGDDLARAVATIHRRCLEGFAAWCSYVSSSRCPPATIDKQKVEALAESIGVNTHRPVPRLFVEALLLRVMESLGEQVLQCPERVAFVAYGILADATDNDDEPATFSIDLDELHEGLKRMHEHSNPYVSKRMSDGTWSRGINFDDINECGIQCRPRVQKTYREPSSILVLVDFFICYRIPFMIKLWTLGVSAYIYLGSGIGNDITTNFNGSLLKPKWLRINYVMYSAIIDAAIWVVIEAVHLLYVLWQRWPSLCHRSPGVPDVKWMAKHIFNVCFSFAACYWIYSHADFVRKPWQCRQSDVGECVDQRSETYTALLDTLWRPLVYWASRVLIFTAMHRKTSPMFIHGTPWKQTRKEAGRGVVANCSMDLKVNLAWICMLAMCMAFEVFFLLPSMRGLNWNMTCGFDVLGNAPGLPQQVGTCTHEHLTYGCVTCVSSINLAFLLIFLGALVDIYFVFYVFSAIFGSVMGHRRHLNDLKNTSLPIDLRPYREPQGPGDKGQEAGREAKRFEFTFGPGWQQVWKSMVEGLLEEWLISPVDARNLCEAAGIALDGDELQTHREKKEHPIHLNHFPALAAERLAFFFHSLQWIERGANGTEFNSETDALTGERFDPGSIPSLTQIIPSFNECVIPSEEFLRAGGQLTDAMNQSPLGRAGVGDLTDPPRGDGVNTNLAFMISQFPDEWDFLAQQLHTTGQLDEPDPKSLYASFMKEKLRDELVVEIRFWASLRMQSVAKTVIGALQYERALASLPAIKDYYRSQPEKRVPEDHAELVLAHQTYGSPAPKGNPENDEAVRLLLSKYAKEPVYLVFDLTPDSSTEVKQLVETFLRRRHHGDYYEPDIFKFASVKCRWDSAIRDLRVVSVLPRKFPLLLGTGNFRTQGKASNQLNGLRFASGHNVQAMDCNMGVFIGEGFKVPYVLRLFMPLDKRDRVATKARYIGFREYIFTGREGSVGKCHAAAEWTFGTIYQRFLSGIGTRMHYGHPDFVDCFWARNRGGMSKSSPVVNLSEDIFAGYNVRMREELLPHVDALEFEKGREATFNAASNFFAKISGGSIAVIRSRDNHLICERVGILHSLSFYFTSVAFYVSNYLIDLSIVLYVMLFIVFTLANIDLGRLSALGSTFSREWVLSMGIVSLFPQLFEMVLEYGTIHAVKEVLRGFTAATFFFIFQNKNIAQAMRNGAATGIAKYLFTGRPMANQHQTWKDCYVTYWKSHYKPAFDLIMAYIIYYVLVSQTFQGVLPMVLVVISFVSWLITPIVFSPFPRFSLLDQDVREFNSFINGRAGMNEDDIPEVIERGKHGRVRTLYECGLADEISVWGEQPVFVLVIYALIRVMVCVFLAVSLPSEILDYLWVFLVVLSLQWVLILGFFATGLSNIFLSMSILVWLIVLPFGYWVHGARAIGFVRMPEYVVSLAVFLYLLGLAKSIMLTACRAAHAIRLRCCCCRADPAQMQQLQKDATKQLQRSIRTAYVFFFVHQLNVLRGYLVLIANLMTSLVLILLDMCNAHTWWLLNSEVAKAQQKHQELENYPEIEDLRQAASPRSPWSPREMVNTWRSNNRLSARSVPHSARSDMASSRM